MLSESASFLPLKPYALSCEDVIRHLATDGRLGLCDPDAESRLITYGENHIPSVAQRSRWSSFLSQFNDPQMFLLLAATSLSLSVSLIERKTFPVEASLIFSIAILNGILGFIQEQRAEQALAALKRIAPATARVIRDGEQRTVDATKIVPGDLIVLIEGVTVPADARLISVTSLQVTEALLTGESGGIYKSVPPLSSGVPLLDQINMVFGGTAVLSGEGLAIVCATGHDMEMGKIAELLATPEDATTRLQAKLKTLSRRIVMVVGLVAVISAFTFLLLLRSRTFSAVTEVLLFGISLGVAAAPEAMGTIITLTLAVGVRRLAKRGAIVRKMNAVDVLGGVNVVMSDKTGTLTKNQMTVTTMEDAGLRTGLDEANLLITAILANSASLSRSNDTWLAHGDPLDCALWRYALDFGTTPDQQRERFSVVGEYPFTSERKMMSIVVTERGHPGIQHVFAKGAPEEIAVRCKRPLPSSVSDLMDRSNQLASRGLKVLALAYRRIDVDEPRMLSEDAEAVEHDLHLVGIVGLYDPPRPHVKDAIAEATAAGIRTILITGDHPRTAVAIAQELGIAAHSEVVTGDQMEYMKDAQLAQMLDRCGVLARVTAAQKMRAAQLFQSRGQIVAMTGDGVNDAPALRAADIGIAMGSGTDIAKGAADIVLTDDNFATIVLAVREGRILSANIKKAVSYLISTNLCEVTSLFVAAIASMVIRGRSIGNLPLPITTPQILWINLITDTAPALALALSPSRANVMSGPPQDDFYDLLSRQRLLQIFRSAAIMSASTVTVYFALVGAPLALRRTATLTTLILCQSFYALTLHSDTESILHYIVELRSLSLAVLSSLGLHAFLLSTSIGASVFGLVSLSPIQWTGCIGAASAILLVSEVVKYFRRHATQSADRHSELFAKGVKHATST